MLYNLTTTPVQIVKELDALTFGPYTGLEIRQRALDGAGHYDLVVANAGPDIMYWANGHDADADSFPILAGQRFSVATDKVDDVTFASAGTSALYVEYMRSTTHMPTSDSAGGGGGPSVVTFETIYERQRQDNDTLAGLTEYTELIGRDQLGVETVLSTFLADGTPYVATGVQEFNPLPACCFDVEEDLATFKVNGAGYAVLKVNPADATVFWDDDNDVNGKGIVFSIPENLIINKDIATIQWSSEFDARLSENASIGATGATNAERKTKTRIFIKLFDTDQITPIAWPDNIEATCTITTKDGASFVVGITVGAPVFNVTRKAINVASGTFQVTQTATPTEALIEFITWQPNKLECEFIADWQVNNAPTTGEFEAINTPCNFIFYPALGSLYNPVDTCDQGGEYTNSLILPTTSLSFQPIGTDSTPITFYRIGQTTTPNTAVFSYDKN